MLVYSHSEAMAWAVIQFGFFGLVCLLTALLAGVMNTLEYWPISVYGTIAARQNYIPCLPPTKTNKKISKETYMLTISPTEEIYWVCIKDSSLVLFQLWIRYLIGLKRLVFMIWKLWRFKELNAAFPPLTIFTKNLFYKYSKWLICALLIWMQVI